MSLTMTATMNVTFQEMATAIAVLCCPDSEHSQRIILCCPDSEHTKGCQHRDGTVMFKTGMEGGPRSAPRALSASLLAWRWQRRHHERGVEEVPQGHFLAIPCPLVVVILGRQMRWHWKGRSRRLKTLRSTYRRQH